ncbi:MAG: 5'-methylthioadenosine/adenosylhomocysteine nucleosidase [Pantoea sp. Brub]|nr:5'-methylthioadenosine/adenosylhomocysteine nucleosidase [Pantoea sp. Brub]
MIINKIMNIGIIAALKQEINSLLDMFSSHTVLFIGGCTIYKGHINNVKVFIIQTGVGKTSVSIGTTLLLYLYQPKCIINIGLAGSLSTLLKIGDIVISTELSYHDVDITAFNYPLGQISGCPLKFLADKNLIVQIVNCIKKLNFSYMKGMILSGDSFINSTKSLLFLRKNFPQAIAVEMEGASVAHICYKFNVPFVIIRYISDNANMQSNLDFNKQLNIASVKLAFILKKLITNYLS